MRSRAGPAIASPSAQAADVIFRDHASWLRALVRRRFGHTVSADDIVQEAYLRLPAEKAVRHPRAFLLRVASRLALDQIRRQRRSAAWAETQAATEPASIDEAHERLLLRQILDGLPAVCRETFLLNRFGGFTYEEISARQGVSVKTVEWRISKALAYCADRLEA